MSRILWVGVGAGGLGWYLWRKNERDQLEDKLASDPLYSQLAVLGMVAPPRQAAEEAISFTEATTAADAYVLITTDLPSLPAPTPSRPKLVEQIEEFEKQTGIAVPGLEKVKGWFDFGDVEEFEEITWGEWLAEVGD